MMNFDDAVKAFRSCSSTVITSCDTIDAHLDNIEEGRDSLPTKQQAVSLAVCMKRLQVDISRVEASARRCSRIMRDHGIDIDEPRALTDIERFTAAINELEQLRDRMQRCQAQK